MKKLWRKMFPVSKVYIPYASDPSVSHVTNYEGMLVFTMNDGTIYMMNNRDGFPTFQKLTTLYMR